MVNTVESNIMSYGELSICVDLNEYGLERLGAEKRKAAKTSRV